jgi:transcriptional regulator with XRE-family HTH domain
MVDLREQTPKMITPDQYIGQRIAMLKEKANVAADELETNLELGKEEIAEIEMGKRSITASHLVKVANYFKVHPSFFFEGMPGLSENRPVTEDDVTYLMQNFLKVNAPDRGQLFKDFVQAIKDNDDAKG